MLTSFPTLNVSSHRIARAIRVHHVTKRRCERSKTTPSKEKSEGEEKTEKIFQSIRRPLENKLRRVLHFLFSSIRFHHTLSPPPSPTAPNGPPAPSQLALFNLTPQKPATPSSAGYINIKPTPCIIVDATATNTFTTPKPQEGRKEEININML